MTRSAQARKSRPADPSKPDTIAIGQTGSADRRRLSGPGLRSCREIAELWGLSEQDRIRALGSVPRSTYHAWMQKAVAGQGVALPLDTLLRISAVLGVHKALGILFEKPAEAMTWLKSPHHAPLFGGQRPIDLIASGSSDAVMQLRRYLDAWRGGTVAPPVPGLFIAPISETDVVFL